MSGLNPFRDINVTASESYYTFHSPSTPDAHALVINRPTGDIRLTDTPALSGKRLTNIAGILGIIKLRLDKYIIIITKAQLVGRIRGHLVYKIQATEFLPLQERQLHDPDEDTYLELLRTHLRTGPMYFSYTFDLTSSFQRQSSTDLSLPLWQRADDRFFWNRYIQSDLIDLRSSNPAVDPYILPTFFGFLSISTTTIKSTPCTFILITRKSRHRAGTRYFTRGLDAAGHVANFNETEQAIILGDTTGGLGDLGYDKHPISTSSPKSKPDPDGIQVFSYVQTRGSVPVYWSELPNLKPIPTLQVRGMETALPAARAHFTEQITLYGDVHLVNLVNQGGREAAIKTAYETLVASLVSNPTTSTTPSEKSSERFHTVSPATHQTPMDRIHYTYFDFHHECRNMRWHRASLLLDTLSPALSTQAYFHSVGSSPTTSSIRSRQQSVVRTNCMDCLDRTNIVQSMLARHALTQQMRDASVLGPTENAADYEHFETMYRNAWADNADVVSRAYSGTGALKTDFTRSGVRTRAGAVADWSNSATRWVRNNFADGPRQDAYDLFLGVYLPSAGPGGGSLLFEDRRPLVIQAVPYVLAAAVFLVGLAAVAPREGWALVAMRAFVLFWTVVGTWAGMFLWRFGELFVGWPKLVMPGFAAEGYERALRAASGDAVVGEFVGGGRGHERGVGGKGSVFRIERLEEGKKRIE